MAITLASSPTTSQPIPISDCLRWVFEPDSADVITTPGVIAEIVVTFPGSPTDPGNGTEFVMWGYTFTTDSGSDFTATSFDVVVGNKLSTMNNFAGMVASNFFFARAVSVEVGASTVTLTWNECGEQENFGATQMFFDNIEGSAITSAVATNGTTPVYVDGYRIAYRLRRTDVNTEANSGYVTNFEGMEPNKGCTTVDDAAFDAMPTVRRLLKTPIPDLDLTHPAVAYDGIIQYFSLIYGWIYRDGNCQSQSGLFEFTGRSFVWNAYFQAKDVYRTRKYWPGATGGLPPGQSYVKFLTTSPDKMRVFVDSKCWLWYMVNGAIQSWTNLRLNIAATKHDGSGTLTSVIVSDSGYGINAVNVSPDYIISLGMSGITAETLSHYTVKIMTQNSGSEFDVTQITEDKTFYVMTACNTDKFTDLYFLTPIGGIGTIPVQIIESNVNQAGDEILLDVPCTASREDKARYGGRTLSNIRSYESFTFRSIDNGNVTEFFRDLKLSPQRWVKMDAEDGSVVARKLIIEPGGVKIYEDGPTVTVEVTGYLGDIIIQSGTEPEI
jgi:hypothetical protein